MREMGGGSGRKRGGGKRERKRGPDTSTRVKRALIANRCNFYVFSKTPTPELRVILKIARFS